ncbi:GPW/gp25 family protein [Nitrosomonas nitrosa]|uniref:GPW/gp25 family protein n=1 Tax=Nitrosomonas nitrosa TaxID=52442 RepID=UPI0023F67768|nr:GPW/gp25 family protein [Nitrosomonas nitrosa]MCO6434761.1 GPW/gp25 family protein [Nitrosomonas nitrosa]
MKERQTNLLGQGLSFPPRIGADGRLAWSAGEDNVRESIRIILMTEQGERIMRETFGCSLRQYLFEPNNAATHQRIRETIIHNINRWEPRVIVDDVTVEPEGDEAKRAAVIIYFRLVATQASGRLGLSLQFEE